VVQQQQQRRQQQQQQQQGGGSGMWSLLDDLARPWTPQGEAQATPLQPQEVPGERAAVAALKQGVLQQLSRLPTSIQFDQALLGEAGAGWSVASLSSADEADLPAAAAASTPTTLQQRVAVQARLEHKLLLKETLAVLMAYEQHLGRCFD
jgi:uncharacterized protein (DUF2235 family)